jgi:hypothetical protein
MRGIFLKTFFHARKFIGRYGDGNTGMPQSPIWPRQARASAAGQRRVPGSGKMNSLTGFTQKSRLHAQKHKQTHSHSIECKSRK